MWADTSLRVVAGPMIFGRRRWRSAERWAAWPTPAMHFHFPDELRPLREDPRFDEIMTRVHDFWGLKPDGSLPEEG